MLDCSAKGAEEIHSAGPRAEGGLALDDTTAEQGQDRLQNVDEIPGQGEDDPRNQYGAAGRGQEPRNGCDGSMGAVKLRTTTCLHAMREGCLVNPPCDRLSEVPRVGLLKVRAAS